MDAGLPERDPAGKLGLKLLLLAIWGACISTAWFIGCSLMVDAGFHGTRDNVFRPLGQVIGGNGYGYVHESLKALIFTLDDRNIESQSLEHLCMTAFDMGRALDALIIGSMCALPVVLLLSRRLSLAAQLLLGTVLLGATIPLGFQFRFGILWRSGAGGLFSAALLVTCGLVALLLLSRSIASQKGPFTQRLIMALLTPVCLIAFDASSRWCAPYANCTWPSYERGASIFEFTRSHWRGHGLLLASVLTWGVMVLPPRLLWSRCQRVPSRVPSESLNS